MQALFWRAFYGDERLSKVFWFYYVLVGAAMTFALYRIDYLIELQEWQPIWSLILRFLLSLAWLYYLVWVLVSLWRCAFNCQVKLWGYVVRGLVVVHAAIPVVAIATIPFRI